MKKFMVTLSYHQVVEAETGSDAIMIAERNFNIDPPYSNEMTTKAVELTFGDVKEIYPHE